MRVLPVGDAALLVEVADTAEVQAAYRRIRDLARDPALPTPREVVPAARTVLLEGLDDVESWRSALARELTHLETSSEPAGSSGREVTLRVRYDGPDLEEVAAAWGCHVDDVVRRHLDARFTVAFCGFAPGFAYCASDPPLPEVPRRLDPRPKVPAGSVALAGPYCGVYPREMPGGWQLIATTEAVLFDPDREHAALLSPGDLLRFEVDG